MNFDTYFNALEICSECLRIERARLHDGSGVVTLEVNGEWMFRIPRDERSSAALARELEVLRALRSSLPISVPDHEFVRRGDDGLPTLVGSRRIAGHPLPPGNLEDAAFCRQLGRFLGALHSIDPAGFDARRDDGAVPVHGRLSPEHLLCAEDSPALVGVIGWSGVGLGDAVLDLVPILALGGPRALQRVLDHYDGARDPSLESRVHSRYKGPRS